jgi:hypothetical protein
MHTHTEPHISGVLFCCNRPGSLPSPPETQLHLLYQNAAPIATCEPAGSAQATGEAGDDAGLGNCEAG